MFKLLSICAALIVFGSGSVSAQEREAVFQKIEVPNANFVIVLATAKPDGPKLYYRDQPDPNIIYLGSDLVTAYTAELAEMLDVTTLMHPVYSVAVEQGDKSGRMPAIVYIVPKRAGPTVAAAR